MSFTDARLASGYAANLGALTPKTPRRGRGQIHFSRSDGPANVQFSAELTDEAAKRLDSFLRQLLEEDAPALAAEYEAERREAEAQQLAAMQRYQSQAMNNANAAALYGGSLNPEQPQ